MSGKKSVSKDIKSAKLFYFKEIFDDIITLKFYKNKWNYLKKTFFLKIILTIF